MHVLFRFEYLPSRRPSNKRREFFALVGSNFLAFSWYSINVLSMDVTFKSNSFDKFCSTYSRTTFLFATLGYFTCLDCLEEVEGVIGVDGVSDVEGVDGAGIVGLVKVVGVVGVFLVLVSPEEVFVEMMLS